MSSLKFQIRGVETAAERAAVRGLLTSEFEVRPGVGAAFARLYGDLLERDPQVSAACSRVALAGGRVVGHALLAPRRFWMDGVEVPGGVLAMVVVAPEFRGQGIGRALVEDAEALALERGLLMTHLAGDLRFYRRFGYVEAYLRCRLEVAAGAESGPALRRAGVEDAEVLAGLSAGEAAVGAVAPSAGRWRWVLETGHPFGLLAANNVLLGFYAGEDFCLSMEGRGFVRAAGGGAQFAVYEAGAADAGAAGDLLAAVRGFAGRNGYRRVALHLPPDNRLTRAAVARGAQAEVGTDPDLLAKVLDPQGLMERLEPVLSGRLRRSGLEARGERLSIRVEGRVFTIEAGRVRVEAGGGQAGTGWRISLPGIALTRAVLGTDRLGDRAGRQAGGNGRLRALLDALFPQRAPFFWLADSL